MPVIEVTNLSKTFQKSKQALKSVDLAIEEGEMVALIGASGSGKSTLLRHLSGLICADRDDGKIVIFDEIMQEKGRIGKGARSIRADIGVVFQQFNLVTRLTVLTNVLMGLLGRIPSWRGTLGLFTRDEKMKAMRALERVGIADQAGKRASNLSGGQQQRAAIARALTQGARVLLADEPIASLDPASSKKVMTTLRRINEEDKITVVVSLHQVDYALEFCPRTIAMRDGEVVFDGASSQLTPEFLKELYGDESIELLAPEMPAAKPRTPVLEKDLALVPS
ncbi:phosphonate ABC transporter ATP-binding protein [Sneathiella limimaris]|uniref:phosphonate ABC transporter ATP-binding protein n=1 Tax=Sneathiella limimaris TaxID=1964213 RepID=UPI00146F42BD